MHKKGYTEVNLYREIAALTGLSETEIYRVFRKFIQIAGRELQIKKEFEIPELGTLTIHKRREMVKRVRFFKEKMFKYITLPACDKLKFKISKDLKLKYEHKYPRQTMDI
jgi:nucleoid DNA-binding protein